MRRGSSAMVVVGQAGRRYSRWRVGGAARRRGWRGGAGALAGVRELDPGRAPRCSGAAGGGAGGAAGDGAQHYTDLGSRRWRRGAATPRYHQALLLPQ